MLVPDGATRGVDRRRLLGQPRPGRLGLGARRTDDVYASGARTHHQPADGDPAALEAVRDNAGPLLVVSDSTYVVNCFRDRWWQGWLSAAGRTRPRSRSPTATCGSRSWSLCVDRGDVAFGWVKGHSGDPMNDLVDALAVAACRG